MIKSHGLSDIAATYHAYDIQWTPDSITWLVDGKPFRVVNRADTWHAQAKVFKYPESEAHVSFSVWDGGAGEKGTADWAGGAVQWAKAPFVMGIKSVHVTCHFKGNETTYTPPAL
ncbi:putative glycosidase CRH2 [Coemansia sp. RSA 552]|nr:putative glycosidase CRH2 [Coemansia sp. RSA 552]